MRRRAEQVEQTRQRIVEAAVGLHTTVGPARTTVSALAEQAGVTRLTVYRHFPDADALFVACLGHWAARHPAPDPTEWLSMRDPEERAHEGLAALYRWYGDHSDDLLPIYRDFQTVPPSAREALRASDAQKVDALVDGWATGQAHRRLRAAAGHAVNLWTWYSLALEQDLGDEQAARMMASLLAHAAVS